MRNRKLALLLAAALTGVACTGEAPADAGPDVGTPDASAVDTGLDAPVAPPDPRDVAVEAAPARMFRLTRSQYRAAVTDLFGDDIVIAVNLEPDVASNGYFAVGAGAATVSRRGAEAYEQAALDIAHQAFAPERRSRIVACAPTSAADADCARTTLEALGRRVWRRPLSTDSLDRLVRLATEVGTAAGDLHVGLEYATAALLQAPQFLFRVEVGVPDDVRPAMRRLDGFEVASRLSFLLWNTTPDDALLDAAAAGELDADAGLEAQTQRLLSSPRARAGLRNFFEEYLKLSELEALRKDPDVFAHASPDLGLAAREETLRTIEHFVFELDADYRELFTTRTTFLDRSLAALYDVPAPAREGFAQTELPADGPRAGLLGQASFLALHAHPTSSSATRRGVFVRTALLCGVIPPPPADVDTSLPEPDANAATLRERVAVHLTQDDCAACHLLMDPIGLGFEQFDGLGRFRTHENGAVIDPSGDVDGATYVDAAELGSVIAAHPNLGACLVQNLYRFATGRVEEEGDWALLDALAARFASDGFRIRPLVVELVMSDGFRMVAAPEGAP